MRINKYLASCGIGSRRKCEEYILNGLVTINDKVIKDLSTTINPKDIVKFESKVIKPDNKLVYILLNKPKGVVTTCNDERGRTTVLDLINPTAIDNARIFPVGRLDYNTEGLLILTNDGEFARKMTHPSSQVEKVYVVTVDRKVKEDDIKMLENGVMIDGEITHPAKAKVTKPNIVELTITQGRNRQVRKMFESLGYRVTHLKRTKVGKWTLGTLKVGDWIFIRPQ